MTDHLNSRDSISTLAPIWVAGAMNMIWINLSEVFRYFAFVMPMMHDAFPTLTDVAPMDLKVFAIWGIWDTILVMAVTTTSWLALEKFGAKTKVVLTTATGIWAGIFVILWLGLFNMNLATVSILAVALPLAWIEMVVAVFIVRWALTR